MVVSQMRNLYYLLNISGKALIADSDATSLKGVMTKSLHLISPCGTVSLSVLILSFPSNNISMSIVLEEYILLPSLPYVDNDTLKRLLASPEAMKALMNIEGFRNLNSDLATIINKSEAVKKAKKENPNPTPKEKKELSDEEKEMKSKRKQIQEKLIKFATRIPVFMYLTDYRERCLKDVITQLEPGLFKKVTGLSVADFNMLCTLGVFNAPLMNDAIFKFKRYEDASLTYTGINKHDNDEVGGWDTTIRKSQYERLFYNQQASMTEIDQSKYNQSVQSPKEPKPVSKEPVKSITTQPKPTVVPQLPKPIVTPVSKSEPASTSEDIKARLEKIELEDLVHHKKFGKGEIVKINKNEKFIYVKFMLGEKKFMFPDAFLMGFLELL